MSRRVLSSWGYEIGQTIGEGAYSKVKLVTSQTGSHLAVKIINRRTAPRDYVKKFLPRELAVLKLVRHENIIRVHQVIELFNRKVYIVMDRAATDLLLKIQEVGRIPVEQAKHMFSQMVSAVSYLHQKNIVHRDLKCENVLLMEDGQVKIADFGFARTAMGYPELSETYCGSAAYAPPEVLLGKPYDPKKHDVWSTGVILYVMVTGKMPYNDTNIAQMPLMQQKPVVYTPEVIVPQSCQAFISFLLQFIPVVRPSIEQVVQHSWLQQGSDNVTQ